MLAEPRDLRHPIFRRVLHVITTHAQSTSPQKPSTVINMFQIIGVAQLSIHGRWDLEEIHRQGEIIMILDDDVFREAQPFVQCPL